MKNVNFDEILKTREIAIPDTDIVLKVQDLSWPDFMESVEIEDAVEKGIFRLRKVIVDWNLVDKDDKKIEVSEENIRRIPANIMLPIVEAVKDSFGSQKKR